MFVVVSSTDNLFNLDTRDWHHNLMHTHGKLRQASVDTTNHIMYRTLQTNITFVCSGKKIIIK